MAGTFVLIDKHQGATSAQAVAIVRRLFNGVKTGHTGTLDPMATGLLTIALGEAAGYIRFMPDDKAYRATVSFGAVSDTGDAWGNVSTQQHPPADLVTRVRDILPDFIGTIMQTAPQHSALKYKGKPLYHYARKNISVPEKRRQVRVHELTLEKSENDNITLFIRCGGGFYVRSLAHDLGVRVGCGAYLSALRRLQCAPFDIAQAQVLDSLTTSATAKQLSIETALTHLPAQSVDNTRLWALAQGQRECPPSDENEESGQLVRLQTANNRFAGVARQRETCFLPQKLLSWTREKKNYDN